LTKMSRRALLQGEAWQRRKEELRRMQGIEVPKPPKEDPPGTFPYRCNPVTMDLGNILYSNITESLYFTEDCALLETFEDIVDEIYSRVDHLEPFVQVPQNAPSSAFCLLYTLFCKRLTERQLDKLVTHPDSIYIRAIGFLYLRYTAEVDTLWTWFSDYVDDPAPIKVRMARDAPTQPLGMFLRNLIKDSKYLTPTVRLPRIPKVPQQKMSMKRLP